MDKKQKKLSDTYFLIIIILAILIFIGGIVLGDVYKITQLKDAYKDTTLAIKDYMYETTFNTPLMLTIWASDFIFTLFMLLVNDILKVLEDIKNKIKGDI